jgi:molecular chaperone HscA
MLEESFDYAEDDIQQRQLREARVDAETILHATATSLERHAERLEPGERERIDAVTSALTEACAGQDHVRIRDLCDELSRATEPFAQRIMDAALQESMVSRSLEEL